MEVIHTAVEVSDIRATEAFYGDALGLERRWQFTGDDGVENHYFAGDAGAELQFKYDPAGGAIDPPRGIDHLAVGVDDAAATFESVVEETGCPVVREPNRLELARATLVTAFLEDPDGYVVELVETVE